MALSEGVKIARVLAIAAIIGLIVGMVSRLSIVGNRSTEQIMSSGLGWVAIACIAVGAWGLGSGLFKMKGALKLLLSTLLVTGGLMWVIPLPH